MRSLLLLLGAMALVSGASPGTSDYLLGPTSVVTYEVTHPLHGATGVSHRLSGTIRIQPGPPPEVSVPVTLSVPVASFTSGNRNRDRNMLTTLDAARYPDITLTVDRINWADRHQEGSRWLAKGSGQGRLTFHGLTRPVTIPLDGVIDGRELRVHSRFSIKLSDFRVERPSLFFRPIGDDVPIDVEGVGSAP